MSHILTSCILVARFVSFLYSDSVFAGRVRNSLCVCHTAYRIRQLLFSNTAFFCHSDFSALLQILSIQRILDS